MLFGAADGGLEVRARKGGGATIAGSFPYNSRATLHSGGKKSRPRKEQFAPGSFQYSLNVSDLDIHFLSGHDFGKALASRNSGSLILTDTAEALTFEARLSAEVLETTHGKDFMAMLSAGLVGGISPGFRVAPVDNAEEVTEEDPSEGRALIRTINEAVLFELSAVTRPAYDQTTIDQRSWELTGQAIADVQTAPCNSRLRWRL